MGDHNHLFKVLRVCVSISILVLSVNVLVFDAADEDRFLFLPTNSDPPPSCPQYEFYKTCMSNCSDCEYRGICDLKGCKHKGCDCIMNFVRMTPGGPCEPVHFCPVPDKCGENEVYRECGPVCEWCSIMRCRILQCDHKCYCKEGYLRNLIGKCIPQEECPPKLGCSKNEEKVDSGPVDEYCLRADDEEVSNATQTKEKCYCKEGFKRNMMGHCVEEMRCEFVKCLNGEVYQNCPKKCDTTCRNYGDTTCKEDGECYPGCFCPDGYFMNDFRRCVKLEDCPPGSNPFAPTVGPTTTPAMTESTTPTSTGTTPTAPSQDTTESDASESTLISTTAPTPESTIAEETTETSVVEETTETSVVEETTETLVVEGDTTSVPVTSTTETADQSSAKEASEEETKATTQKPRSQKGKDKRERLTIKDRKATTPTEEGMDDEN